MHSLHTQTGVGIHCTPKRASTFIASIRRASASWHAPGGIYIMIYLQGGICIHCISKGASAFIAYPNGHWHSLHTEMGIHIHCIPTRGICIMVCTMRTFASCHTHKRDIRTTAYLHEHLHHDIPSRRHLHHDMPIRRICTTRHIASPSLQGDICITVKYVHWHHHR